MTNPILSRARSVRKVFCENVIIDWFDYGTATSTMDVARLLVDEDCPAWTVVTAGHQTEGRGTNGRGWYSRENAGLYFSVVLPPPSDTARIDGLTIETASILSHVLDSRFHLSCTIKHPNDLLSGGKKIVGILYESVSNSDRLTSMILGMGINLAQTRTELDEAGLTEATSFLIETGSIPSAEKLLMTFLEAFIPAYRGKCL